MKKKASELMGEPVSAGSLLSPRGFSRKVAWGQVLGEVAGGVGTAAATALIKDKQPPSLPRGHYGPFYMAVGSGKIAFFSIKRGFFGNSVGELLVEHPRTELQALEVGKGMVLREVRFVLRDGTTYLLECGNQYFRDLKKVEAALG